MDTPRSATFRGRRILTAHLASTLPGTEGTAELLAFGARLGLKAAWLQNRGEPKEHFDIMGDRCRAAQDAGAVVDRHLLVQAIRTKREAVAASPDLFNP